MLENPRKMGGPQAFGRHHVVAAFLLDHLSPDHSRQTHPGGHTQGDVHRAHTLAQGIGNRDQQHDARDGRKRGVDPDHQLVDQPPEVPPHRAQKDANRSGDHRRNEPHAHRDASPLDHLIKNALPENVRTQPHRDRLRRGWQVFRPDRHVPGRSNHAQLSQKRHEGVKHDDKKRSHRHLVLDQALIAIPPKAAALRQGVGRRNGHRVGSAGNNFLAHLRLTRGSTTV